MTREEAFKIEGLKNSLLPVMRMLRVIDHELEFDQEEKNYAHPAMHGMVAVNRMIYAMFTYEADHKELDSLLYSDSDSSLVKTVKDYGKNVMVNNRPLSDIVSSYTIVSLLADSEVFENLVNARKKFLLDLKKTFESLLDAIPAPQFPDNK